MDVRDATAGRSIDLADVALDPVDVTQLALAGDRHHLQRARTLTVGARTDADLDRFLDHVLERAVYVAVRRQRLAVHRQQVFTGGDGDAGCTQRGAQRRAPVQAAIDLLETVATVRDFEVRSEQSDADVRRLVDRLA